jgi:hypothetical protein
VNVIRAPKKLPAWILLVCCLIGGVSLCHAEADADRGPMQSEPALVTTTQDSQHNTQTSSSNPSTDKASSADSDKADSDKKEDTKDDKKHRWKLDPNGSIVAAPVPIVSPALGAGIIPVMGYITPIPAKDKKIEPSVFGAAGLITDNGTRGWGLGTDLYLDKSHYEVESVYAHGNLDYNLYGVGFVNGNAGFKLPLEPAGHLFFFKALRHIGWVFYAGIRFIDGSSFITLKPTSGETPPIPLDVGLHTDLRALGMEIWRDSRPNRFYPLKGSVLDFTGDFFAHNLGSKYSFQSYRFSFNKYWSLTDKRVLAYNFYWCGTGGSPPLLRKLHLRRQQRAARLHRRPVPRSLYVCDAAGVPLGPSMEVRPGWLWGRWCSRSRRRPVFSGQSAASRRGHGHSLHVEQEVPRQSADRFRMGQRQFHLGCRRWRGVLNLSNAEWPAAAE